MVEKTKKNLFGQFANVLIQMENTEIKFGAG